MKESFGNEPFQLFDGSVSAVHLGRDYGDFGRGVEDREKKILYACERSLNWFGVALPKIAFSNDVFLVPEILTDRFVRSIVYSQRESDAVILKRLDFVLAIANADCHLGVFYHKDTKQLALVHLGLKCIVREDDSPTIIETVFRAMKVPPEEVQVWVGAGIGSCCNGYSFEYDFARKVAKKFPNCVGGEVIKGPRTGQVAFDNIGICEKILRSCGVRDLVLAPRCTACAEDERRNKLFHSNVYDTDKTLARNLFMVRLVS
ncbi:MAG: laccase domain-containing protein [Patescibacteria group bacterium]